MKKTIILTAAAFFTLGLVYLLVGSKDSIAHEAGQFLVIASAIIATITMIKQRGKLWKKIIKQIETLRQSADKQDFTFAADVLSMAIAELKDKYKS